MSAVLSPVVPTTAWIPCSAHQGRFLRGRLGDVKSTTTSAPASAKAFRSDPTSAGPGLSAEHLAQVLCRAALGSTAATQLQSVGASTARQTSWPIRPPGCPLSAHPRTWLHLPVRGLGPVRCRRRTAQRPTAPRSNAADPPARGDRPGWPAVRDRVPLGGRERSASSGPQVPAPLGPTPPGTATTSGWARRPTGRPQRAQAGRVASLAHDGHGRGAFNPIDLGSLVPGESCCTRGAVGRTGHHPGGGSMGAASSGRTPTSAP